MSEKKAVFIDVDGTLTDDVSGWEKVHLRFDLEDEMNRNIERFFSGEIDYDDWALEDVVMWKGKSYHDFQDALKDPKLREGAIDGVKLLKNAGFDVILVSGGLDEMVKHVAIAVNADQFYSNDIGHTNGILDGSVTIKVGNSKSDVIKEIAEKNNYNLNKCGAIGDNVNDIGMFELVAYAVAINTEKEDVIAAADEVVYTQNFVDAANKVISIL
ncbi:MAG: HAD family hydrolase [Candidatus Kariarchaeaceae archaeon]|jgi:phosphoserine phosphatase